MKILVVLFKIILWRNCGQGILNCNTVEYPQMFLLLLIEYILDEAKTVLSVSFLRGIPMPEEMKV